ncbi:MAG: hypothetical protein KDK99_21550, partial [Verrucomicrobiales bacterium]|nr:hypothetical protein [Verrucomicrobiales bacterium]
RIAADLHDGLCQELSALHFGTASLRSLTASTSSEQARQLADAVVSMAAAAVEHARTISHGLSPMLGNPGNLEEAIRRLADTSSDIQLLPCKVRGSFGEDPIQEEIATQLYHIAVEAVHNARKHSNATSVVIDLQRQKDHLSLRVRDNGIGLPPSALHSNTGRGLRFMQYRADQAGATLHISPGRSGGSVVVCEVNLPAPQSPPKTSPHHGLTPTPPTD